MMVGAFAIAGTGGVQDPRYAQQQCGCGQQNPLAEMIRTILDSLGPHHPHHCHQHQHGFNQGNPNFGQGAFAGNTPAGPFAAAGGNGPGLNASLAAQDPFGGGIAAAHHAGPGGISNALSIKDPFGGGISVADSAGPGGISHALSLKLPFGGPSLNLGGSISGLLG